MKARPIFILSQGVVAAVEKKAVHTIDGLHVHVYTSKNYKCGKLIGVIKIKREKSRRKKMGDEINMIKDMNKETDIIVIPLVATVKSILHTKNLSLCSFYIYFPWNH